MGLKPLSTLEKIGEFVKKYTGSNYDYGSPSGNITNNFTQIGEIFGIPIWVDTGKQYESELLDFPTLGDILSSIANTGIHLEVKVGDCSACMTITYAIPFIEYPPIIICLGKKECEKKEDSDWSKKTCITLEDYEKILQLPPEELVDLGDLPPLCPLSEEPEFNFKKYEGKALWRRIYWYHENTYMIVENSVSGWYLHLPGTILNWGPFISGGGRLSVTENAFYITKTYEFDSDVQWATSTTGGQRTRSFTATQTWDKKTGELIYEGKTSFFRNINSRYEWMVDDSIIETEPIITPTPTPIPDPPGIMDKCCEDTKKLLARNEKLLKEIHKAINPQQFFKGDVQVPKSWIYPGIDPTPEKADDLPDAIAMILRMIDRRIGFMPQVVHLKDADPGKEGDQPKSLVVNSLADLTKIILDFNIAAEKENSKVNKALLQLLSATMFESGTTHQLSIVMERMLVAICEYLDFEAGYKKETFKMFFNPQIKLNKNNLEQHLEKLIKPHNQQIEIMEWKGGQSEKDKLNEIIKKVSLAAAALSSTKPLEELVKEHKNMTRLERMLIIKEMQDREGISDLKEFQDDAEKGYPSSEQSELVKKHPYGFDSGEPKFRRTTKKSKKPKYTNKSKGTHNG